MLWRLHKNSNKLIPYQKPMRGAKGKGGPSIE